MYIYTHCWPNIRPPDAQPMAGDGGLEFDWAGHNPEVTAREEYGGCHGRRGQRAVGANVASGDMAPGGPDAADGWGVASTIRVAVGAVGVR